MKVLLCLAIVAQICSSLKQVGRSGSAKHSSKKQNVQVSTETDADSLLISHEKVSESANFIMKNTKLKPKIGIICGSGLAGLSDLLEISDTLAYKDIPNFPASTIEGHLPNLVIGTVQDTAVIMMLGKFFILEGHSPAISAMPVRVMKLIGVEILIVTNSAGGINRSFKVGDIMVIKDHINLPGFSGVNPLRGPNDDGFGERFFAMNNGYDRRWRKLAKAISKKMKNKLKIHEGVYVMITGPNYETVAELKMMQMFGADAVGMSSIPEVLVARHSNMSVFSFSFISNKCVLNENDVTGADHDDILDAAIQKMDVLLEFTTQMISEMATTLSTSSY